MRKYAKKNLKFFPSLSFSEDLVWSAFYSKTRVFPTFLKRGSLEFAHIRSTCGPDLPRARHTLRFDVYFRHRVTSEKSTVCARHNATAAAILKMNDTAQNEGTKGIRAQKGIAAMAAEEEDG